MHSAQTRRISFRHYGRFIKRVYTGKAVLAQKRLGFTASTIHVSYGSLITLCIVTGTAYLGLIGKVMLARLTTLPAAGPFGWLCYCLVAHFERHRGEGVRTQLPPFMATSPHGRSADRVP